MNILVTGSSGWLGQTLVPRLERDGHRVVGLDPEAGPTTSDRGLGGRSRAGPSAHPRQRHRGHRACRGAPQAAHRDARQFGVRGGERAGHAQPPGGGGGAGLERSSRFVFTSTTSLMISQKIRDGRSGGASEAIWIDETMSPLEPRNIYGVTKRAAEELCRLFHHLHKLPILILRTARFFPEEDDMAHAIVQSGENTKANEFLFRRLSVEDAAEAHVVALAKAPGDRLRHLHHLGPDAVLAGRLPRADRRCAVRGGALLPRLSREICEARLDDVRFDRPRSTTRARPSGSWASSARPVSGKCWTGSSSHSCHR